MYQRWYQPGLGVFASQAPYPPQREHQYGFAFSMPNVFIDPLGENPKLFIALMSACLSGCAGAVAGGVVGGVGDPCDNCLMGCLAGMGHLLRGIGGSMAGGAMGGALAPILCPPPPCPDPDCFTWPPSHSGLPPGSVPLPDGMDCPDDCDTCQPPPIKDYPPNAGLM